MSRSNNRQAGRGRFARVMLHVTDACELPGFVLEPEYFPFGSVTATVRADKLVELERHRGVLGLWLQSEERLELEPREDFRLSVELQVPPELVGPVAALFPGLVAKGAQRVEVFGYSRPGEGAYWLAFVFTSAGRQAVGTPNLRSLPLSQQVPDLARQLSEWCVGSQFEPL